MDVLETFIEERQVDEKLRAKLFELAPEERGSVENLISQLSPSANTLREYLRLGEEIAIREERSLDAVLGSLEISQLLEYPSSKKERQKLIRQALEQQRFPKVHKLRSELESCQKEILADLGLRIELPRDLEGDTLSVTISAKNARDFEAQGVKMTELSAHPALARIYSLLKGDF